MCFRRARALRDREVCVQDLLLQLLPSHAARALFLSHLYPGADPCGRARCLCSGSDSANLNVNRRLRLTVRPSAERTSPYAFLFPFSPFSSSSSSLSSLLLLPLLHLLSSSSSFALDCVLTATDACCAIVNVLEAAITAFDEALEKCAGTVNDRRVCTFACFIIASDSCFLFGVWIALTDSYP